MADETIQYFKYAAKISAREVYGKKLVEAGKKDKRVVVLTADLMRSNKSIAFFEEFPERFFNVGIAEQDMMGIAAGLALEGMLPFVSTYSTFASMRACEQVRTDICYSNLPVKIIATHSGLTSQGGPTHFGQEDIAIMRSFANMTVIVPGDPNQIGKVIDATLEMNSPVYIRIGRGGEPVVYKEEYNYEIGKSITINEGKDLTVIACGPIVTEAMRAAYILKEEFGLETRVINIHTIKPIDKNAITSAANETDIILTVEEHQVGGFGNIVSGIISMNKEYNKPFLFDMIGVEDRFGASGQPWELMKIFGLTAEFITKKIELLNHKK